MINVQQGIKNKVDKVIQNQLEISRKVVICLNGFITMVLWTFPFPWLYYIRLFILLCMHSLRHLGHGEKAYNFFVISYQVEKAKQLGNIWFL